MEAVTLNTTSELFHFLLPIDTIEMMRYASFSYQFHQGCICLCTDSQRNKTRRALFTYPITHISIYDHALSFRLSYKTLPNLRKTPVLPQLHTAYTLRGDLWWALWKTTAHMLASQVCCSRNLLPAFMPHLAPGISRSPAIHSKKSGLINLQRSITLRFSIS